MLSARPLRTLLLALTPVAFGCSSSAATNAAIGTGMAVAAVAINRAVNDECLAACRPGLVCNHASGLCVEPGSAPGTFPRAHPLEPVIANPAGREYEVPALSACDADAGACADGGSVDAGAR